MIIRTVLTLAVLGSLFFGAAAEAAVSAQTGGRGSSLTAQIDGFASDGGLGTTRVSVDR